MPQSRYVAPAVVLSIALVPLLILACQDAPVTEPALRDPADRGAPQAALATSVPLPFTGTVSSTVPAFEIRQAGSGHALRGEITSSTSNGIAMNGVSAGPGHALLALSVGRGRAAVLTQTNTSNTLPAVEASTSGRSNALRVIANNTANTAAATLVETRGTGALLQANHLGASGPLALFQVAGANRVRFSRNGRGYFNGGTQTGGADVAEAFGVEGSVRAYRPGDVMAISERSDRRVELSSEAYSTRVIGVYATKPGVLLTERGIDDNMDDLIPVGVIGVIPTRVSGENGPIGRGDLLVSAGTPGHAMLGTERDRMLGAVIGKALAPFQESGTGVIPVLVNVR
jgi:hypothetical protein